MKYCDKHNHNGILKENEEESIGFCRDSIFLKRLTYQVCLIKSLTIHGTTLVKQFWQTATASTLADGTLELRATIDTLEYTITEASVRKLTMNVLGKSFQKLTLQEDAEELHDELFEESVDMEAYTVKENSYKRHQLKRYGEELRQRCSKETMG
ncbi:hypothetical protein Tco_1476916 [Tanacetum coccineum]